MMSEAKLVSSGLIASSHNESDSEDIKSSSTEGPDSPCPSSSASPIPPSMMIPPSPHHLGDRFKPQYSVRFTDHITKDGDTVRYRLNVRKIKGVSTNETRIITIDREYEDFEYFHQSLMAKNASIDGLCIPPLPSKPTTDAHSAEAKTKKQLGSENRYLRADDFARDCRLLEKYLYMVLSHPILGKGEILREFLENSTAPIRTKVKRGIFYGVLQSIDHRKYSGVPDIDDSFQKERDWISQYASRMKRTCDSFHGLMNTRLRLANQIAHLSSLSSVSVGHRRKSGASGEFNRLSTKFSNCLMEEKSGIEALLASEDRTLAAYLDLYSNFAESVNTMLMKRTSLMVDYDNSSKALAKAKISKVGVAKIAKERAEKRFKECSELAEAELKRFHQMRLSEMKEALLFYAEGQVKAAREASGGLKKALEELKNSMDDTAHNMHTLQIEDEQ